VEPTREIPRDTAEIEQVFAKNLTNEVRAWTKARSLGHGTTETGIHVVRRTRAGRSRRSQLIMPYHAYTKNGPGAF
jgi:hypothetical protein